jgi:carbon-monoxide dehydrogenase medium subunit
MKNLEEYLRPSTPQEAVDIKRRHGAEAVYLGGGTDLLVHRPAHVRLAIDIRRAGMDEVEVSDDGLRIGGAALLRQVEQGAGTVAGGMLVRAVRETAPWLIRNAATLAGNIANASPAADSVPALIALDASLHLLGDSEEQVLVEDVLAGPHRTTLGDRLVRFIVIPRTAADRNGIFIKHSRSKSDIAQVNLAVAARGENGMLRDVRIVLGAVAPTAIRVRAAEQIAEGQVPDEALGRRVEEAVAETVRPIDDWRASAAYRRRISGVLARRALAAVAEMNGRERVG